jgi:hypothetical protein
MAERIAYQVGDWVRFYRDARMVIAVVEYIHPRVGWNYLQTDRGEIREDHVLEYKR